MRIIKTKHYIVILHHADLPLSNTAQRPLMKTDQYKRQMPLVSMNVCRPRTNLSQITCQSLPVTSIYKEIELVVEQVLILTQDKNLLSTY